MSKNILHIIGSLGVGGAETLLVNTLQTLDSDYKNILVYLNEPDILGKNLINVEIICLHYTGKISLPGAVLTLRRIIRQYKIDIVHSHLFLPTIIARLACPKNVRLLFSVHSMLSEDAFKPNPKSKWLEKFTYRSRHEAIFVSNVVRQDYNIFVGLKGKNYVLYNFISDDYFFKGFRSRNYTNSQLKFVALGNLKEAKNYPYLIRAFKLLDPEKVSLDIYGEGHLKPILQEMIDKAGLKNIKLKGLATDVPEMFQNYDAFVLASEHEGFGLAAIEGMACGLPCFLSDLSVFKEVTGGDAIFFDLKNENDFAEKVNVALNEPELLEKLSKASFLRAKVFNRSNYIKELSRIYGSIQTNIGGFKD